MLHYLKRFRAVWGVGVTVLAMVALGAAPAAATTIPPGSVEVVVADSVLSSDNKQAQAFCPQGKRVIGGGALVSGSSNVVITESRPISQGTGESFLVTALEDQTKTTASWMVRSFVFCAVAPPGLEIVTTQSVRTSEPVTQQRAQCPAGKGLIGSGGLIQSGFGELDLGMVPNGQGFTTASTVIAKEDADGFAGQYRVVSFAVCATGNAFPDFQVSSAEVRNSQPNKKAFALCPIGYRVTGVAGATGAPGTHLVFFKPTTAFSPSTVEVAATTTSPIVGDWGVTAIAYCAR